MRALVVWMAIIGCAVYAQAGPLDKVKPAVNKVVPELWTVKIHLKSGEVVAVEKVAMSKWGVTKRLAFNSLDKVVVVLPVGAEEVRRIPTADIEKIEIVPAKIVPEVVPQPKP